MRVGGLRHTRGRRMNAGADGGGTWHGQMARSEMSGGVRWFTGCTRDTEQALVIADRPRPAVCPAEVLRAYTGRRRKTINV